MGSGQIGPKQTLENGGVEQLHGWTPKSDASLEIFQVLMLLGNPGAETCEIEGQGCLQKQQDL